VPADLSVVGFDDIEMARHLQPPLTTVHQPIRRKGEEACRLLLAAIERQDTARPDHRLLGTRLIVRASSGPAPQRRRELAGDTD
jgi:DNA-binding LacI/PurR family transcriptional regulator